MDDQNDTIYVVDADRQVCQEGTQLAHSINKRVVCYGSAYQFLSHFQYEKAACLILELRLPDMSGLEIQKQLNINDHKVPVIFLTAYGDIPSAVTAIKAGAINFLEKPIRNQLLLDNIHQALNISKKLRREQALRADVHNRLQLLTPREKQVKDMIIEGKPNKVIAADLGLSIKTIEAHRSKIMRKMNVLSVSQLVHLYHIERAGSPGELVRT